MQFVEACLELKCVFVCRNQWKVHMCICVCVCAEEEDVVNCILFLLSEKSSMINGVALPVDGGHLAC